VQHLDTELHALDDIVTRVQRQNDSHHAAHEESLQQLASNVQASYASIKGTFETSFSRVESLEVDMARTTGALQATLPSLSPDSDIRQPLGQLRARIGSKPLLEYSATGLTPARKGYSYPTALPRTDGREVLLSRLHADGGAGDGDGSSNSSSQFGPPSKSPGKGFVFADAAPDQPASLLNRRPGSASSAGTTFSFLRELNPNTLAATLPPPIFESGADDDPLPPLKRLHTSGPEVKRKRGLRTTVAGVRAAADRENVTLPNLSASVGVGAVHPVAGRRLRSHERNNVH
jgi:kinesin family protein 11